jgi:hypothetical protein
VQAPGGKRLKNHWISAFSTQIFIANPLLYVILIQGAIGPVAAGWKKNTLFTLSDKKY